MCSKVISAWFVTLLLAIGSEEKPLLLTENISYCPLCGNYPNNII